MAEYILGVLAIIVIVAIVVAVRMFAKNNKLALEKKLQNQLKKPSKIIKWDEANSQKAPTFYFAVDDEDGKVLCFNGVKNSTDIFKYEDIVDFAIVEDNDCITTGNGGKALLGGMFLGGVGAIAGASSSRKSKNTCFNMEFQVAIDNLETPWVTLPIITKEIEKNSEVYKGAQEKSKQLEAIFKIILKKNKSNIEKNNENEEKNNKH